MRVFLGAMLVVGLLAGCGGVAQDAAADVGEVHEATCLSQCQAEYHQCMVENAGNGPGKVLCGYALNACKANCPPAVGQAEAAIVIPDCATYQGHACAAPRARQGCYNYQEGRPTPGLCICGPDLTWSCG